MAGTAQRLHWFQRSRAIRSSRGASRWADHSWPHEGSKLNDFIDAYTEFHGSEPDSMVTGLGYDEIYLIAQIIEDQGEATPEAVIAGLADAEFDGVTGTLVMNPDTRRADKEVTLVEVQDGDIGFLETRTPENVPPVPGD